MKQHPILYLDLLGGCREELCSHRIVQELEDGVIMSCGNIASSLASAHTHTSAHTTHHTVCSQGGGGDKRSNVLLDWIHVKTGYKGMRDSQ